MLLQELNSINNFNFDIVHNELQPDLGIITISKDIVDTLYKQALLTQKTYADTSGFTKGQVPLQYIERNFKPIIIEHIKELIFTHCVLKFLYQSLNNHKIVLIGDPILKDIYIKPTKDASFHFKLIKADKFDIKWKKLSFKAPTRKKYKDLDKQVKSFIRKETENLVNYKDKSITYGDWIYFSLKIINKSNNSLLDNYKDVLWVYITNEESDRDLQHIFLNKNIGDIFHTNHPFFQNYISSQLVMDYTFEIEIKDTVPNSFFCIDLFKHHFNIKNAKDMHLKFVEVFSTRNDISQRRETAESVFKLLSKYYFITIPKNILERQKQQILHQIYDNPDYIVYKAQPDFKQKIHKLAEKQLKEIIIIDTIAYQENIKVSHKDLTSYLNFTKRNRMKEFLYFSIPDTKFNTQEMPQSEEILKLQCLREKTLNYVIKNLTKK